MNGLVISRIILGLRIVDAFILIAFFVYWKAIQPNIYKSIMTFLKYPWFAILVASVTIDFILCRFDYLKEIVDVTLLTAFIGTLIFHVIFSAIMRWIQNRVEDVTKLTDDYRGLMRRYEGSYGDFDSLDKNHTQKVPIMGVITNKKFDRIKIKDNNNMYELPEELVNIDECILSAHDTSWIYNQVNIRVDDWKVKERVNKTEKKKENVLYIYTSRTNYYFSLMTNRAMDYKLRNGFTIRNLLQPGPFVPRLKDSILSNHLGFNAIIVTKDRQIPFIKRYNTLSIAKNTYGTSVSASIKLCSVLSDYNSLFNKDDLIKGIESEIIKELKLRNYDEKEDSENKENKEEIELLSEPQIIAAYRDIVEGNKPQLLVYAAVNKDRKELNKNFKRAIKEEKKERTKEEINQEDGKKLYWFKCDEFLQLEVLDNAFKMSEKTKPYNITPSVAISIKLMKDYLESPEGKKKLDDDLKSFQQGEKTE